MEDPQWSEGIPDPFEEDLHRQLFGTVDVATAGSLEGNGKQKRKRKRENCANEIPANAVGFEKLHGDGEASFGSKRKTKKSEEVIQQENTTKKRWKQRRVGGIKEDTTHQSTKDPQSGVTSRPLKPKKKHDGSSQLYDKLSSQLEGSRFRMINQQLYTSTGADAKLMFDTDPKLFEVYHKGLTRQVSKWPSNPLDRVIDYVKTLPLTAVVCDFGCGEARLAESVKQKVHSFDLVAINERATACDMTHVPLKRHTVDLCIFCLSLMGTNVSDFIREARRVVKRGGEMRICEVSSRFSSFSDFVSDVEVFGFKSLSVTEFSTMFVEFVFTAVKKDTHTDLPQISLKPCMYKRR